MIKFHGESDDIVIIECTRGPGQPDTKEQIGCYASGPYRARFLIGKNLLIHAIYDGCWSFAAGKVEEDIEFPTLPITIKQSNDCPYSTEVIIGAPDNALVHRVAD